MSDTLVIPNLFQEKVKPKRLQRLSRYEGGLNTKEVGGGGVSNMGVTQDTYNAYRKRKNLPIEDVKNITIEEKDSIFDNEFYEKPKLNTLPENVGDIVFDYGVNASPRKAIKDFQSVIGTKPDGLIGPETQKKTNEYINQHGEKDLLKNILNKREEHNKSLIEKAPNTYKKFEKGWQNRINDLKEEFDISSLNPFSVKEANAAVVSDKVIPNLFGTPKSNPNVVKDLFGKSKSIIQEGKEVVTESGKASLRGFEGLFSGMGSTVNWIGENIKEGIPQGVMKAVTPGAKLLPEQPEVIKNIQKKVGNTISKWGKNAYSFWREESQRGIEAPDIETFKGTFMQNPSWTRGVATVAEAIPSLAGATVIGIATGNPLAGAAALGLLEGSGQYVEARQAGKDVRYSNIIGGLSTVGNTILEVLPITRFVKGGEGKILKDIFIGAVQEGGEEVLQALWQNTIAKIGYDKTRTLTQGMVEGFIGGAGSGGVLGGFTSGRGEQMDSLMKESLNKGVTPQQMDAMQEAVKNQIVDNADEIDSKIEQSAIDESDKYDEWLKSRPAGRQELDVPLHPAPKTSIDKGVVQRLFDEPITPVTPKAPEWYASRVGQKGGILVPGSKESLIKAIQKISPKTTSQELAGLSVSQLQGMLQEQPFIQEAKKYKSAEQFLQAQGELYHGTLGEFEDFLPATEVPEEFQDSSGVKTFGTYFTDNKKLAEQFGKNIKTGFINKNKLLDLTTIKSFDDLVDLLPIDQKANEWELQNMVNNSYYDEYRPTDSFYKPLEDLVSEFNLVSKLKEMGYEGLIYNDVKNGVEGKTFTVFEPKNIKTKSQLTSIWNKAQTPTGEGKVASKISKSAPEGLEVGALVKWNGDESGRIDKVVQIKGALGGGYEYITEETNPPKGQKPKMGKQFYDRFGEHKDKGVGIVKVSKSDIQTTTGGGAGSSAAAVSAKAAGYGTIETSEKSTKGKVAKTNYAKIGEEIPSREETNIIKEALKIIAPARVSPLTKKGALILRKNIATLAHNDAMAQEATQKAHRAFQWMNTEDSHKFIDDVESGRSTKSELQPFADMLRGLLDGRRINIQNLGKGQLEGYYENYFPHIWKDPKKAKNIIMQIMGRKRLEGTKSFLKKRVIVSVKDGLERGLELVSDNPVDLVLLKIHEMDRYIMAQNIIRDSKEQGLAKFVYARAKKPEGYSTVNDNAFTVFMPPEMTKKEAFDSVLVEQLTDIAKTLGIDTKRFVSIGGKRWGYAQDIGKGKVRTRWAGPESVLAHEIGHVLGYQYDVYNTIGRRKEGETKVHKTGKKAGQEYFKPDKEAVEYRRDIDKQWRDLADARFKGSKASDSYKNYVRNSKEKEAVLVEALIHAPKEFQRVAPDLYKYFVKFINNHAELRPLLDIEPSLVLGEADAKIKIPGFTTLGHYYMPEDLARLINNHLSPGLRNADNKLVSGTYNVFRGMGNILNQVNLALSAFHALNVTTDIWASTTGLAIKKFFTRGQRLQGMVDVLKVPIAPILSVWEGTRIKKAYRLQIDSIKSPKVKEMVKTVVEAGGRDRMDVYYYNAQIKALEKTFRDVLKGSGVEKMKGVAKIPFNIFGATLETIAKPLMQWYVPTGKLGLFSKLAQYEMERAESGEITDEQLKGQLASVWDSVDNRMGQLIYDNLFWNKTLKDTLMLLIRSVGWNLGSWREYGGGAVDVVNTAERLRSGDKLLSHKMSYVLGAGIVYSILGAVIQYILTGKPPEEPKDYFFPKTGRIKPDGSPERLSLPTYAKDIYAYSQRPLQTVKNKAHPLIGLLNEQLQNKDYFNVEVSDFSDPLVDQIYDRAKHIVNFSKPFSFKNYEKMQRLGEGSKATAFVSITGITSAPSYVTRSAAQKLMYRYMIDRIPNVSKTKEDFEKSAYRKQFKSRLRKGEPVDYKEAAQYLGIKSLKRTMKEAKIPPFAESYKRLSIKEALNVYAVATPKEKQQTQSILIDKFRRSYKDKKITPDMMLMFKELFQK